MCFFCASLIYRGQMLQLIWFESFLWVPGPPRLIVLAIILLKGKKENKWSISQHNQPEHNNYKGKYLVRDIKYQVGCRSFVLKMKIGLKCWKFPIKILMEETENYLIIFSCFLDLWWYLAPVWTHYGDVTACLSYYFSNYQAGRVCVITQPRGGGDVRPGPHTPYTPHTAQWTKRGVWGDINS